MYRLWKEDPSQVHPSWSVYFSGMARGLKSEDAFRPPPNLLDLGEVAAAGSAELPLSGGTDVQDHMKVRLVVLLVVVRRSCRLSWSSLSTDLSFPDPPGTFFSSFFE